ncbi:MAG: hypothetical protein JSW64_15435 [Candidatus Zixiibacteriota bacterium]|nr:MAG: hypothetical protein JSW64_15435 [candidate division Zixibacteria bacterium]
MKTIRIICLLMLISSSALAQNYQIDWYVIASGGGQMSSTNFNVNGTVGQPIIGTSSSASYTIESGYWVGAAPPPECDYVVGDVNGSDSYNGLDITYGVNYFKGAGDPMCPYGSCPIPPCNNFFYCGDVNGSCSYNGLDITYGVNYFKGGLGPVPCDDCPPGGPLVTALSGEDNESTKVVKK